MKECRGVLEPLFRIAITRYIGEASFLSLYGDETFSQKSTLTTRNHIPFNYIYIQYCFFGTAVLVTIKMSTEAKVDIQIKYSII